MVSKEEWQGVNLETFEFIEVGVGPKKRSFDLFGYGSVVFVHIPGHSVGLAATIIQNND